MISKLIHDRGTRESYIRSKLSVLIPAQVRSLRLRRGMTQAELGNTSDMKQARISNLERIGETSFNINTLIRLASAFHVGLEVRFVSFSEMLKWENQLEPDTFDVVPLESDTQFQHLGLSTAGEQLPAALIDAMSGGGQFSSTHMESVTTLRLSRESNSQILRIDSDRLTNDPMGASLPGMGSQNDTRNGVAA